MKKFLRNGLLLMLVLVMLPIFPSGLAEQHSGIVRVLLTRLQLTDRLEIALDGSYTLNGMAFQRGSKLLLSSASGSIFVYYEGMTMDAGKEVHLRRHGVTDGKENGLRLNGRYELHPGDLVVTLEKGQLTAVLHAPVEEYLLGVVPYEMSDSFPVEALKAQAVAARTYALRKAGKGKTYDVVDNTNDQAYYGIKAQHTNAVRAVAETAGISGFFQGNLAECFYSASNGGQTELVSHVWGGADYGYLKMADDPYDLENPDSVVKSAVLPKKMNDASGLGPLSETVLGLLSETLESMGYDGDMAHIEIAGIENAELTAPLYRDSPSKIMTQLLLSLQVKARKLIVTEEEEDLSIFTPPGPTAAPQRTESWSPVELLPQPIVVSLPLFPLVENAFSLSINGGSNEIMSIRETDAAFVLEARRYGHGVGMSQRGAQQMAGAYQWTYDQILRFYYPGMALETIRYTQPTPAPLNHRFLTTPGPAATPTPRPTLMPIASTPRPGEYVVAVTNIGVQSYLNLRAQPNTQSGVLRQLYYGQKLIVLEEMGEWLKVRTDHVEGYVMEKFVSRMDAPLPSPTPHP